MIIYCPKCAKLLESSLTSCACGWLKESDEEFISAISRIYYELLANQEPLGRDFEQIWLDNIDDLYEN